MARPPLLNSIQLNYILSISFMNMIDKRIIQELYSVSEKTAERIIKKLGLLHSSTTTINIIKEYLDGSTAEDIAKKYNMSSVNVRNLLKFRKIERRGTHYCFDYHYLDSIDTEEKAYILGFIYADGCISRNTLKICISFKDIDILEKIKICFKANNLIKKIELEKIHSSFGANGPMCLLELTHKSLPEQLKRHGIISNKTLKICFPTNLNPELYKHFIRGYIDGDGSFGKYTHNDGYKRSSLSIVGTQEFLIVIKNIFTTLGFISSEKLVDRWPDRKTNIRSLRLSGNLNVLSLLNWLYADAKIYLDRKYNVYLSMLK